MGGYPSEMTEHSPERSSMQRDGLGINVSRLVKLRARLMILTFLAVAVPTVAAIVFLFPRFYVATAQIEFAAIEPGILRAEGRELTGGTYENYVNTQVRLLTGNPLLSSVLEKPEVQALDFTAQEDPLRHLRDHVDAQPERGTQLVEVSYRDEDRDTALTVLNAILDEYREYINERELERGDRRRQELSEKETELRQDLERQRAEIAAMQRQYGVSPRDAMGREPFETESFRNNLAQAEADHTTRLTALRQAEMAVERTRELLARHQQNPTAPVYAQGVDAQVNQDPHVALLLQQATEAEQQLSTMEGNYVDTAPRLQLARENMQGLRSRLEQAKARARGEVLRGLIAQQEYEVTLQAANVEDADQRRQQFQALLDQHRDANLARAGDLAELEERQRVYEATDMTLRRIQDSLFDLDIEAGAPGRANILGAATAPPTPDMSQKLRYMLLALIGAAMLSGALGVLVELSDQRIRSGQDISYITSLPVIATVPHTSEDRLPRPAAPAMVSEEYPSSMTADEFRQAVARILNARYAGREVKTCVVTSPARGDGKSTLACNLAIVLAQADRKVLLVDVDSRNPSIERNFDLRPGAGLSEMLSGEPLTHDPDRATDYENLYVLGPGLASHDLVERLASVEMRDFLDGAEELFDHIILDTPATLLTSETRLLTHMADAVVVVVGAGVSSFGMVRRCLSTLESNGANIIGIVLNAVRQSPGGYLRRNLDSYYSHSQIPGADASARASAHPRRRGVEPSIVLVNDKGGTDDR